MLRNAELSQQLETLRRSSTEEQREREDEFQKKVNEVIALQNSLTKSEAKVVFLEDKVRPKFTLPCCWFSTTVTSHFFNFHNFMWRPVHLGKKRDNFYFAMHKYKASHIPITFGEQSAITSHEKIWHKVKIWIFPQLKQVEEERNEKTVSISELESLEQTVAGLEDQVNDKNKVRRAVVSGVASNLRWDVLWCLGYGKMSGVWDVMSCLVP